MKKILIIDDDPLVLRMYQEAMGRLGFQTDIASDGLAGIMALRKAAPDLLVLDLMMPKFTGVEVLKFIRTQPALKELPVIVLSNTFVNELGAQAVELGVQRALLKMSCTPTSLANLINDVLAGKPGKVDPSQMLVMPKAEPPPAPKAPPISAETKKADITDFTAKARQDMVANVPKIRVEFRELSHGLAKARSKAEIEMWANNFYRRVHFITASAGVTKAQDVALLASAFEALLFELIGRPEIISPSVLRTVAFTTDFLGQLLERLESSPLTPPTTPQALVVDDDPLSNRLVAAALRRAQLNPRCMEDPVAGLRLARETKFDLVLLDIEMPGMNGLEFCKQFRALPGYRHTPVIFVTSHAEFENRAQSVLSGGNDLISKPVLPIELAVKAVTHLLKANLDGAAAAVR